MPWQQDAADVAYEYDPVTGLFRYDEVDITVPRQSGKTTLTLAKKVHRLTVMAKQLGAAAVDVHGADPARGAEEARAGLRGGAPRPVVP
jgi:phage terminase large subunit-like protein